MSKRVKHIRHTTVAADAFTGQDGEITVEQTTKALRVHDGATQGGFETARKDLTNVGNATASVAGKMTPAQVTALADVVTKGAIQAGTHVYSASGGVADAYVGVFAPLIVSYTLGQILSFTPVATNTGASTFNGGPSADAITDVAGNALGAGAIIINKPAIIQRNATGFTLLNDARAAIIPTGTAMVFYQAAAPAGWTKSVANDNKALRVVVGSGGGSGGTHGLSSPPTTAHTHTGPAHTHTGPSHSHIVNSHTHTGPSHTHTGPSHTHVYTGVVAHTHSFSATTGSAGSHAHNIGHDKNLGNLGSSNNGLNFNATPDAYNTDAAGAHTHSVSGTTGSTGSASPSTNASGTGATGAGGTGATGAATPGTSSSGTGATGSSGTANTGSTTPTAFAPAYIDVIICTKD